MQGIPNEFISTTHMINFSAVQILIEMIEEYKKRDIYLCFVKMTKHLQHLFTHGDNEFRHFDSVYDAVQYLNSDQTKEEEGNGENSITLEPIPL
jgi:enoyl-[acyl-carrier-protein] reductase (NADH)